MEQVNIKKALKKRVEKSGRRWLPDIWDLELADDSRGQSLVDGYLLVSDDVVGELYRDYIRKYDGYGATTPKAPRVIREIRPDRRGEILSQIVSMDARRHPFVRDFRGDVLKNKLLHDIKSVEAWINARHKKEGLPDGWTRVEPAYSADPNLVVYSPTVIVVPDTSRSDYLRYPIVRTIGSNDYIMDGGTPVRPDKTLGRLKNLVDILLMSNRAWSESHTVAFVLTDWQPPMQTGTTTVYDNQSFPALSRIDMTSLDPRLSPKEVADLYAEARYNLMGAGRQDKPIDEKHLALAVFADENCRGRRGPIRKPRWSDLLKTWNAEYPDLRYDESDNNFSRDAKTAWERITGKGWNDN